MERDGRRRRTRYEDPRFGALVAALELVAADASAQERALPALRSIAEAIRKGEPISALGEEIGGLPLPPSLARSIEAIDEAFDALVALGPSAFEPAALRDEPLWARMRRLARDALEELGLPPRTTGCG